VSRVFKSKDSSSEFSLIDVLINHATNIPDCIACHNLVSGENEMITFLELNNNAKAIAVGLSEQFKNGSRILLSASQSKFISSKLCQ